jgi:predicted DNA-binding ribbon-helix-helix protein
MRTTLDIEDDVLDAARELARREHISAGAAVSRLLRAALTGHASARAMQPEAAASNGFRPIAAGDRLVTDSLIDRLRDEAGV